MSDVTTPAIRVLLVIKLRASGLGAYPISAARVRTAFLVLGAITASS